jgi:GH18 family chitinase
VDKLTSLFRLILSVAIMTTSVNGAVFAHGAGGHSDEQGKKSGHGFKVIGYIRGRLSNSKSAIDAHIDRVTHINYAFVNPTDDASGNISPFHNIAAFKYVLQQVKAKNKKIFLSFGGWRGDDTGYDLVYEQIAANPKAKKRFIANIMTLVERYDLDGIDMDWEYPRIQTATIYADFIVDLAEALHNKGKLLSAAVIGTKTKSTDDGDGAAYLDRALAAFDWINLMTYDDSTTNHAPWDLVLRSSKYWLEDRGIPASKAVIGLPIYARPSWRNYGEVLAIDENYACQDQVMFKGNIDYYNGLPLIKRKTQFALDSRFAGVMVWELTSDSENPELSIMQAIDDVVTGKNSYQFCEAKRIKQ